MTRPYPAYERVELYEGHRLTVKPCKQRWKLWIDGALQVDDDGTPRLYVTWQTALSAGRDLVNREARDRE